GMASSEMPMRKAGCAILGIIAEGCSCNIREMLPQILPRLLEAIQDSHYYVRESACFALGQFSEHCQPEILYHHQEILPVIFQALQDPRPTVQGTSCYVLENFCENLLPQTLRPFLPMLMERLASLLHSPQKTTQEMAMAAIAATAVASEDGFIPYTEATVDILKEIIFISEPELFNLRGRALECLGHVAVAVGHDHFMPYLDMGMQAALQGVQLGDDNLKEYAYTFIANVAKVMGHTFDQHLETLVPHLLEVISEAELTYGEQESEVGALDEDDDEDDIPLQLRFHEGYINTKK
ncbi:kap123, partial [Symbiodinium microadriaticum]